MRGDRISGQTDPRSDGRSAVGLCFQPRRPRRPPLRPLPPAPRPGARVAGGLLALALLPWLAGCPSPAMNLVRARSSGEGGIELMPFVAMTGGEATNTKTASVENGFGVNAGLAARFGVNDWFEVGLLGSAEESAYLRVDTKFTMLNLPEVALAIDPAVASHLASAPDGQPAVELRAPLLLDVELGKDVALVFGPSYTAMLYVEPTGATVWEHWAGVSVGLDIPFGHHVRVMPEISVPIAIDARWQVLAFTIALAPIMEL